MLTDWTSLDYACNGQRTVLARSSALSPQTWPFSLEWLPPSAYLVGGSVRDALLDRQGDYLDLDFVLPEQAVETARAIARHYKAGFVVLDVERQIARVVFEQGTADFALQVGDSLEADLERRDFRVNAIAYSPHTNELVDPLKGSLDLKKRVLQMVSAENLQEDPLRLLRAYRQAAQLGFDLDPDTQTTICRYAPLLKQIAAERVQSELNYLLSAAQGTPWLRQAWADDVLGYWLPHATPQSFNRIAAIDQAMLLLQEQVPDFVPYLFERVSATPRNQRSEAANIRPHPEAPPELKASGSTRNWLVIAKLACLMVSEPTAAEPYLRRLKYSRNEVQAVCTLLRCLSRWCDRSAVAEPSTQASFGPPATPLMAREQYFFFQCVGVTFPAAAVLAIAVGVPTEQVIALVRRFLDPADPVAHPTPLLTGQDLMKSLGLSAGPQIGQLLADIQLARAEGKITTAPEALDLAARLINGNVPNPSAYSS